MRNLVRRAFYTFIAGVGKLMKPITKLISYNHNIFDIYDG